MDKRDPIALAGELEDRYARYLKTTFFIRDPDLRQSFESALTSGRLAQGPFLEATPVFARGLTPGEMLPSLLGFEPDPALLTALAGGRPLYRHQERALTALDRGLNLVVATGTGSGKTEAFLYPILLHLYRQHRAGTLGSGVRALILYPMNALAHDQRERLGDLCRKLRESGSEFRFTFGQYVGETPENERDAWRHAREQLANRDDSGSTVIEDGQVVHGELVLRSEIRRSPPNILLTNYSMLEYLLLRPDDSPLFDGAEAHHWTFFVLDEAHQYRGAKGAEMAMLLRRLKERLREAGCTNPFRCIATSATLVSGEAGKLATAEFAGALFDEPVEQWDVVFAEREPLPTSGINDLEPGAYRTLHDVLSGTLEPTTADAAAVARLVGLDPAGLEGTAATFVGAILERDGRATRVRQMLANAATEVREAANRVFSDIPEPDRVQSLASLVALLVKAQAPGSGAPLLSCRYHLFLRALEGAFVSYFPEKRIFLDRKTWDGERTSFELALCRECGQHYFVGRKGITTGKLEEPIRDPSDDRFGATFFRSLGSELQSDSSSGGASHNLRYLCTRCGALDRNAPTCGHGVAIPVMVEQSAAGEERADQLKECGACGYTAGGRDPVREVVHGADGPNAVIATTLLTRLNDDRRKLLAFADGRQDAAFFAWYLDDSYAHVSGRNLIRQAAELLAAHSDDGVTLAELVRAVRQIGRERSMFPPEMGEVDALREAWRRIYGELLTEEPRLSLEGVGLLRWKVKLPPWLQIPEALLRPPLELSRSEAMDLLQVLFDIMRAAKAVALDTPDPIALRWEDLGIQGRQASFRIGRPRGQANVKAWDGERGSIVRLLDQVIRRGPEVGASPTVAHAVRVAREIWDAFDQCDRSAPSPSSRLLVRHRDARVLNPHWWRATWMDPEDQLFRCDTCSRVQAVGVRGVCVRYGCPGTVYPIRADRLETNHYRDLYRTELPGFLRVEEHTAQLDYDTARMFQRDFRNGKIHALSCSTTFELGVDLGDLDVVFLRNVPPETFNYAQRVGRAGRRTGSPGFAVTFCRRGPHDLYHFTRPDRMLTGEIRPPNLQITNEKIITRHVAAVVLSEFFRLKKSRFESTGTFFGDLVDPSAVRDIAEFLATDRHRLERTLTAVVPRSVHHDLGLHDGSWTARICGVASRLAEAQAEIASDYRAVKEAQERSAEAEDYKGAGWARDRARTIYNEPVLSFLSRKAVIPKYGFPVDVVELDTHPRGTARSDEGGVSLQRDLEIAIAEFAPSAEVIANKRLWKSYGVKKVAEREWERWWYVHCRTHQRFERVPWRQSSGPPQFERCCESMGPPEVYLNPRFGFVTSRMDRSTSPRGRPARLFSTRPYFVGFTSGNPKVESISNGALSLTPVSPGHLLVLCEGRRRRGFYVCRDCGAGFRESPRGAHRTPIGQNCNGVLDTVALGHDFVTDVLRLHFHLSPEQENDRSSIALTVAYALVEGAAECLEVPPTDLSATVAHGGAEVGIPPIVLFDRVPGGAGLVSRLQDFAMLEEAVQLARERVGGACGCDPGTSCYGCLRNYRNQYAHARMQRGWADEYLQRVLGHW